MQNIEVVSHPSIVVPSNTDVAAIVADVSRFTPDDAAHWSQIITETVALGFGTFDCKVGNSYPRQDGDRSIVDENAIKYCIDQLDEQQVLNALYRVGGEIVGRADSAPSDENVQQTESDQSRRDKLYNIAIIASLAGISIIVLIAWLSIQVARIIVSEATHKK